MNVSFKATNIQFSRFERFPRENNQVEIPFSENIITSFSQYFSNNFTDQIKSDLIKSFNTLIEYYKNVNLDLLDSSTKEILPMIIQIFISCNDLEVLSLATNCLCYGIQFINELENCYSVELIQRFLITMNPVNDLRQISNENENKLKIEISQASQYILTVLLKDPQFRQLKNISFWIDIAKIFENPSFSSSVLFSLSQDQVSISVINDIIYSSFSLINSIIENNSNELMKESFENPLNGEIRKCLENCIDCILNCIKQTQNIQILTQIQSDVFQFLPQLVSLLNENICSSQLCHLFFYLVKKGIVYENIIHEFHLCEIFMKNLSFGNSTYIEYTLKLFALLLELFKYTPNSDFVCKCLEVAAEGEYKIRKAAVLLICLMIEKETIDVRSYFTDFSFFILLTDLIMIPATEIMIPLLDGFLTLMTLSDSFVNFLVSPQFFNELEYLNSILEEILENTENEKLIDLAEDIIDKIRRDLPKSSAEMYGNDED